MPANPLANANRIRINELALAERLPTMHGFREYVESGGLMSYGPNTPELFRRAAEYVDKILRGAKPGDFPIEQPTKFNLVMNLKTAKALGIIVPPTLLTRADEVMEKWTSDIGTFRITAVAQCPWGQRIRAPGDYRCRLLTTSEIAEKEPAALQKFRR